MNTLRTKAIVLSIVFAMCVLVVPFEKVSADSFPSEFYVNSEVYYSPEAMFMAYTDLNETQREICAYILGMYNLMYLGARGFAFKAGAYQNESQFIAKIKSFGYRFLNGAAEISLKSRMDANFCKYASACILYSSQCNVNSFDVWFDNLDSDFVLPVDQGLLNSFTLLYNDNSVSAIASYGDIISPWQSGLSYNYALIEYEGGVAALNEINNVASNYNYLVFSNLANQSGVYRQCAMLTNTLPDVLFIKRYNNGFKGARYGHFYGDQFHLLNFENYRQFTMFMQNGRIYSTEWRDFNFNKDIFADVLYNDLSDYLNYIFTSFTPVTNQNVAWVGAYPYIKHVVLVDDLNTLTNAEEVFNTDSWDLLNGNPTMLVPVDNTNIKPKVITEITLPDNSSNDVSIQDIISIDNTVDDNDQPVNPWQINVIVQPNETNPISIDVNMFSSGKIYLEYLWEHTKKVAMFAKDILDCFEFDAGNGETYGPKYAIYGVLVLGVAGGMIAKFLL